MKSKIKNLQPLNLNAYNIEKWMETTLFESGFDVDVVGLTISSVRQQVKSACEFYLRYRDNPELLAKEHPEFHIISEILEAIKMINSECKALSYYNRELFKFTFSDVLKEEEK